MSDTDRVMGKEPIKTHMKEKLLAALNLVKSASLAVLSFSPFLAGVLIGYFGKPIISALSQAALSLVKALVG